jgi:O-antigen/teichoic acid export membrane protein
VTAPRRRSTRIVRNTLSNSVGRVVTMATSFVMTPFILHSVGEAAFGTWVLANVLVSYGALLDLGMGSAIVKHVADARAREDIDDAHTLLATATRAYAGLAVVAVTAGLVLSTVGSRLIGVGTGASTGRAVLVLVSVTFAINLAATPVTATLRGLQRYDVTNALTVVSALTTAALTVVVLRSGGGLVGMVAVTVPVALVSQAVAVVVLRRVDRTFAVRWSPTSRSAARKLTRFGLTLTVSQVAVLLQKRTSEIVIGALVSVSAVAPYALARRLSDLPHMISDQFIKVLLPVASELHATGSPEAMRRLYLASTRVTLALMFPLGLCTAFLSADLLELWVGAQYRDQAVLVVILVIASVAFTSQWPAGSVFQGMGRFGPFAVASLLSGVANVALSLLLVRPFGLVGVAVGTLVPTVLEAFFFAGPYSMRKLGIPGTALLRQVLAPTVLPALPCAAVLVAALGLGGEPSWVGLVVTGALATGVYLGGYLLAPAAGQERAVVTAIMRRRPLRPEL